MDCSETGGLDLHRARSNIPTMNADPWQSPTTLPRQLSWGVMPKKQLLSILCAVMALARTAQPATQSWQQTVENDWLRQDAKRMPPPAQSAQNSKPAFTASGIPFAAVAQRGLKLAASLKLSGVRTEDDESALHQSITQWRELPAAAAEAGMKLT